MRRVYPREEVCIGCGLCEVYCQVEHSQSREMIRALKKELPRPLPLVRVEKAGHVCFAVQCRHCAEPACAYACLTGALRKDPESGLVIHDAEKCIGCWTCVMACPFGAIRQDKNRAKIAKCDLCPGRDIPACVANCPNEALVLSTDGGGEEAQS